MQLVDIIPTHCSSKYYIHPHFVSQTQHEEQLSTDLRNMPEDCFNSFLSGQNYCHFANDTFKFSFMNEIFLIQISLKFVPNGLIDIESSLVQLNGIIKYLSQFNSLGPSDAIWRHKSLSTLALVMAWCLTAQSHYLNQCWVMIGEVLWHSPDSNLTENTDDIIFEMSLKFTNLRL